MSIKTNRHRIEERRIQAEARNAIWQKLSLEQQLKELDNRFGKDLGAAKQRAKIKAAIAKRDHDKAHHSKKG